MENFLLHIHSNQKEKNHTNVPLPTRPTHRTPLRNKFCMSQPPTITTHATHHQHTALLWPPAAPPSDRLDVHCFICLCKASTRRLLPFIYSLFVCLRFLPPTCVALCGLSRVLSLSQLSALSNAAALLKPYYNSQGALRQVQVTQRAPESPASPTYESPKCIEMSVI